MAIVRKVKTPLGKYLQEEIYKHLMVNARASIADQKPTPKVGVEMIANAIAFGVAKFWSSPQVVAAFNSFPAIPPVVTPPAVTPGALTGSIIYAEIMKVFTEV